MKKLLSILLVGLLCVSVVGCDGTKEDVTLEIPKPTATKDMVENKYDKHFVDNEYEFINYPSHLEDLTAESKDSDLKEEIDKYNKKFYISMDAPDFEITNYKDGVCINRYIGSSEYVEIPETIDGKPVLKLGVYRYQHESIDLCACCSDDTSYYQYYSSPFLDEWTYSWAIETDECKYDEDSGYYESEWGDNYYYGFPKNLCLVKKIRIPATVECISNIGDYTVTFEVDEANPYFSVVDGSLCSKDKKEFYRYNYQNKKIKIPNGITVVHKGSLGSERSVFVPASVQRIDGRVRFKKCTVDNINQVYTSVDGSLLSKDGKELIIAKDTYPKFVVPESVNKILNPYAFANGYQYKIKISKNVKFISRKVFLNAEELNKIIVDKENKWFCSKKGYLYSKDMSTLFCVPVGSFFGPDVYAKTTKVYINAGYEDWDSVHYEIKHDNVSFVSNINEEKEAYLTIAGSEKIKKKLKEIGFEKYWYDINN